jgi:hypothetical protein
MGRTRHIHQKYDTSLIVIEEKPNVQNDIKNSWEKRRVSKR